VDVTPANGDGFLVYPGKSGPVPSIRWETVRDGVEDYDYLRIFRDLQRELEKTENATLKKRVEEVANLEGVVPDLVTFTREPQVLLQKRDAIARAIVEMRRALGK
jgi:hypothetical protein